MYNTAQLDLLLILSIVGRDEDRKRPSEMAAQAAGLLASHGLEERTRPVTATHGPTLRFLWGRETPR